MDNLEKERIEAQAELLTEMASEAIEHNYDRAMYFMTMINNNLDKVNHELSEIYQHEANLDHMTENHERLSNG